MLMPLGATLQLGRDGCPKIDATNGLNLDNAWINSESSNINVASPKITVTSHYGLNYQNSTKMVQQSLRCKIPVRLQHA